MILLIFEIICGIYSVTSSLLDLQDFEVCKDHYASSLVKETWPLTSRFQCYFYCGRNPWCRALTIKPKNGGVECIFHGALFNVDCHSFPVVQNLGYKLLLKKELYESPDDNGCKNGGTYSGSCSCPDGFTGNDCERYYHDCGDAFNSGASLQAANVKAYMIQPSSSPKAYEGLCNFYGHIVILLRNVGAINIPFNKTLEEYKYPFGVKGNYWIGLELLHAVTNQGIAFNTQIYCSDYGTAFSIFYFSFRLTSGYPDYQLTTGSISVDPGNEGSDGLGESQSDVPFCTYDRPCNGYPNNIQGGWWYVSGLEKYALTNPFPNIMFKYRNADFTGKEFSMAIYRA